MKAKCLPLALLAALLIVGCSTVSTVERAELTDPISREDYIANHPECQFKDFIKNGEIVRGMTIYDVIASWGLPNVYITGKENDNEYWIYYIGVENSNSILIYTLTFNEDTLKDWDIDQKRFIDRGIVSEVTIVDEKPIRIAPRGKR